MLSVDHVCDVYAEAEKLGWSPFQAIGGVVHSGASHAAEGFIRGASRVAPALTASATPQIRRGLQTISNHTGTIGKVVAAAPVLAGGVALARSTPDQRQRLESVLMPPKQAGVPGFTAALTADTTRALGAIGKSVTSGAARLAGGAGKAFPSASSALASPTARTLGRMAANPTAVGGVATVGGAAALGTGVTGAAGVRSVVARRPQ